MAGYRTLQKVLKSIRSRNDHLAANVITSPLNSKMDVLERMAYDCATFYGLTYSELIQSELQEVTNQTSELNNVSLSYRELQQALRRARVNGYVCRYPLNSKKAALVQMYLDYQICLVDGGLGYQQPYESYNYDGSNYTINYGTGVKLNQRRVGVELEFCTRLTRQEVMDYVHEHTGIHLVSGGRFSQNQWKIKSDGSISEGWEIVSPPLVDFNELLQIMNCLESSDQFWTDRTCGLHIHLEAKDMTRNQMVNYFKCWQALELGFDGLVERRRRGNNSRYCYSIRGYQFNDGDKLSDLCRKLSNRYYKLNPFSFLKYGTFEVRQLEGTLNYDRLNAWINLQKQVLEYSLDHSVDETVNHINSIILRDYAQV